MAILNGIPPIHPGAIFAEFTMPSKQVSQFGAAAQLGITVDMLGKFLRGEVSIDDHLANRLSTFTGCSKEFWLELQVNYDVALERAARGTGPQPLTGP